MHRRSVLLSICVAIATLLPGGGAVASAAPPTFPFSLDFGSLGAPLQHGCSTDYYKPGDWRMGARELATAAPVGPMVVGYKRLSRWPNSDKFLERWWDDDASPQTWKYPKEDGFVLVDGKPVKKVSVLTAGTRIDRFGGATGNFFAPEGTSYTARALPPGNLANTETCNYHVYQVIAPLKVYSGPIRPWFGQRGGGTQYQAVNALVDPNPECGTKIDVTWLQCAKYIKSVYPPNP